MEIEEAVIAAVERELRRAFAHSAPAIEDEWRRDAEAVVAAVVGATVAAKPAGLDTVDVIGSRGQLLAAAIPWPVNSAGYPLPTNERWRSFTDEEVRVIWSEMTTDDGMVYGYSPGDEPAYSIWCQLRAELERRGMDENRR